MHVRYADNTREASWRDRAGKEGPPAFLIDALTFWLFCYLPSCCATVRPNNISSAHRLMSGHTPCAAFQDRGNRGTTALRRSTCHICCVTRKVRCFACIDLHGVMTPAHPHKTGPIGPVPDPACPFPPKAFSYSGAAIVNHRQALSKNAHEVLFGAFHGADGGSGVVVGRSLNAEHVAYWRGVASIMRPGTECILAKVHMAGYPDHISQTSFLDGCCIWGLNIMPNDSVPRHTGHASPPSHTCWSCWVGVLTRGNLLLWHYPHSEYDYVWLYG